MQNQILSLLKKGSFPIGLLIDPEKTWKTSDLERIIVSSESAKINCILIGGSTASSIRTHEVVNQLKRLTQIPILLFPGDASQFTDSADALLLLNLISGRNPNYLIDQHILKAREILQSNIEVISTSYILLNGGNETSVTRLTQTEPIPLDKTEFILDTCIAGKLIGHQAIYLEMGSGAIDSIPPQIVELVKKTVNSPIIVGGGIRSKKQMQELRKAGADMLVIGTKIEQDATFFDEIQSFISEYS